MSQFLFVNQNCVHDYNVSWTLPTRKFQKVMHLADSLMSNVARSATNNFWHRNSDDIKRDISYV